MADEKKKDEQKKPKAGKPGKGEKPEKSDKAPRPEKGDKGQQAPKGAKAEKGDKAAKGEAAEKAPKARKPEERVTPRLKTYFEEVVRKKLSEEFGYKSSLQVPVIERSCSIWASAKASMTARRSRPPPTTSA